MCSLHNAPIWSQRKKRTALPSGRNAFEHNRPIRRELRRSYASTEKSSGSEGSSVAQSLWTALDVGASLGSVGTAIAFIITQEAILAGFPVVLPLVALYASRQREKLKLQAAVERVAQQAAAEAVQGSGEATLAALVTELQQLRSELQQQQKPANNQLRAIDSKLAALEGSILSAGRSAQEAARQVGTLGGRLAGESSKQLQSAVASLAQELRQRSDSGATPARAVQDLAEKLADLERAVGNLELTQADAVQRISQSFNTALANTEDALQEAVRSEAARALEPVSRLPQLLAAALPVTEVATLPLPLPGPQQAVLSDEARAELLDAVAEEVQRGAQLVADAQAAALQGLEGRPATLAAEQWNALGRRLQGIEQTVQAMQGASSQLSGAQDQLAGLSQQSRALQEALQPMADSLAALQAQGPAAGDAGEGPRAAEVAENLEALLGRIGGQVEPLLAALEGLQGGGEAEEGISAAGRAAAAMAAMQESNTQMLRKMGELAEQLSRLGNGAGASNSGRSTAAGMPAPDGAPGVLNGAASNGTGAGARELGEPTSDSAYLRMQDLLAARNVGSSGNGAALGSSGSSSSSSQSREAQDASEGPSVPISAWLGSGEEVQADLVLESAAALPEAPPAPAPPQPPPATSRAAAPDSSLSQPQSSVQQPPRQVEAEQQQAPAETARLANGSGLAESMMGRQQEAGPSSEYLAEPGQEMVRRVREGGDWGRPPEVGPTAERGADEGDVGPSGRDDTAVDVEVATLVQDGLELLRVGREAARSGLELGTADAYMREAALCFQEAAQLDPASTKVLGNWGNALLAHGDVKKQFLEALEDSPPPKFSAERVAQEASQAQLRQEAQALLVEAGRKFRVVLEQDEGEVRALANWGKALCLRAALTTVTQEAEQLYEVAVGKFERALELSPSYLPALRTCGLALKDLALCRPAGAASERAELLEDARSYLLQVLQREPSDATAMETIRECERLLGGL